MDNRRGRWAKERDQARNRESVVHRRDAMADGGVISQVVVKGTVAVLDSRVKCILYVLTILVIDAHDSASYRKDKCVHCKHSREEWQETLATQEFQ